MDSGKSPVHGDPGITLIGRSSSSFTRVTRIFAAELAVPYAFRVVPSLLSLDAREYGGNPALKLPALQTPEGTWFGSSNICRVLSRRASAPCRVVWPEGLDQPLTANAQELTLAAMSTEVAWIMSTIGAESGDAGADGAHAVKMRTSLIDTMAWLDAHVDRVLDALPRERELSYLEVTLFCLVAHLEFRSVLPVAPYSAIGAFCRRFAERPSAEQTAYRFDALGA
jgi:glutathione S-transferase